MILRGKDNPAVLERISSASVSDTRKYTHQDNQNELITLMANEVLRSKLSLIKLSKFFSIVCDEYTNVSDKEQLSFCIRWINDIIVRGIPSYVTIPSYELSKIRWCVSSCRSKTYNGKKKWSSQQILKEQLKALITHCYGHSLSLSIKDTKKQGEFLAKLWKPLARSLCSSSFLQKRTNAWSDQ